MKRLVHVVVHSVKGELLFRTWIEARALWNYLARIPGIRTITLMPDHVHVIVYFPFLWALHNAMRSYALWRNHHRNESGQVWEWNARPSPISDAHHLKRLERYVLLNACRKGLVSDPLAWPFSTHRDACGLTLSPLFNPIDDVDGFHQYVSADSTSDRDGTPFPAPAALHHGDRELGTPYQVLAAVSSLTRSPLSLLRRRGPQRSLLVRASRSLTTASPREIAATAQVGLSTAYRAEPANDLSIQLVARVLGDPRFRLIPDGDIRASSARGWDFYRRHR